MQLILVVYAARMRKAYELTDEDAILDLVVAGLSDKTRCDYYTRKFPRFARPYEYDEPKALARRTRRRKANGRQVWIFLQKMET